MNEINSTNMILNILPGICLIKLNCSLSYSLIGGRSNEMKFSKK